MEQEDRISAIAGSFGLWQAGVILLASLVKIPSAWHMLGVLFKAPSVDFWCEKPNKLADVPTEVWINLSHPIVTIRSDMKYRDPCEIYDVGYENIFQNQNYSNIDVSDFARKFSYSANRKPCQQFQYDDSLFHETVVTEWHLVCGRKILVCVSQFFYLFGILVGGLLATILMLRMGPRWVLLFGALVQIVTGTATAYAPLLEVNIALRFSAACGCALMFSAGYTICRDITWGRSRILICSFYEWFWSFGVMSLPGLCLIFGTKSWRSLQIVISVPTTLVLILAYFFLPESPRWLLENGQIEEAEKIVRRMAHINGRSIPNDQPLNLDKKDSRTPPGNHNETKKYQSPYSWISWISQFQGEEGKKIIPLHILWAVTIVTYYGALLNVKNLGSSLFLNIFIAGIAEIVGVILGALIILYKKEQRWSLLGSVLLIGGLSCAASWFLLFDMDYESLRPISYVWWHQWVLVALGMSGRIAIACSLTILQVSSADILPSAQVKITSLSTITFARICLLSAPFIGYLVIYGECVSLTAFGSLTVIGGVASILLSSPSLPKECCSRKSKMKNITTTEAKQEIWTLEMASQQIDEVEHVGYNNQSFTPDYNTRL